MSRIFARTQEFRMSSLRDYRNTYAKLALLPLAYIIRRTSVITNFISFHRARVKVKGLLLFSFFSASKNNSQRWLLHTKIKIKKKREQKQFSYAKRNRIKIIFIRKIDKKELRKKRKKEKHTKDREKIFYDHPFFVKTILIFPNFLLFVSFSRSENKSLAFTFTENNDRFLSERKVN